MAVESGFLASSSELAIAQTEGERSLGCWLRAGYWKIE